MSLFGRLADAFEAAIPNGAARGAVLMAVSTVGFQLMNLVIQRLTLELDPLVVSWLRWTFGLALVLPVFLSAGVGVAHTAQFPRHLLRSSFHAAGYTLWYLAIPLIALAEAAALGFSGPVFVTIGAALFLGETVRARRWLAVGVGFLGVLVVLWPKLSGGVSAGLGSLLMLAAVPLIAASNLAAKHLTRADGTMTIVFWQNVLASLLFLPLALWFWQTPSWAQLGWAMVAAFLGTYNYALMTAAFRAADISALQPVLFLSIVWATALDWLAFGRPPDAWTIAGAAVILAGAGYISHREAAIERERKAAAPP